MLGASGTYIDGVCGSGIGPRATSSLHITPFRSRRVRNPSHSRDVDSMLATKVSLPMVLARKKTKGKTRGLSVGSVTVD